MENILIFDAETIPQQKNMTEYQIDEFRKKVKKNYNGSIPINKLKDYNNKEDSEYLTCIAEYNDACRKTMAINPFLGEIVCICIKHVKLNTFKNNEEEYHEEAFIGNEKDILINFWKYISSDRFRYVSYNGLSFDVPFIAKRSMIYGIRPTDRNFLVTKRYQRWPHFDVLRIVSDWDQGSSVKLELLCESLGIQNPKDGAIVASSVEEAYLSGNIKGIAEYCMKDVRATYEAFKVLRHYQPD